MIIRAVRLQEFLRGLAILAAVLCIGCGEDIEQLVATPVFSLAQGVYNGPQSVAITDATAGAVVYFTSDGTTPTSSSTRYTGAFTVSSSEAVKAIAILSGHHSSPIATAAYTITTTQPTTPATAPIFAPPAGNYTSAQSIIISDATPGAMISYAITNGTPPTGNFLPYTGPITVSSAETIFAQATANGFTPSPVASSAYTFALPIAATPSFSPPAGATLRRNPLPSRMQHPE